MRTLVVVTLVVLLLLPLAASDPTNVPPPGQKGLDNACKKAPNGGPCKVISGNVTIGAGKTGSYSDGSYTFKGSVHVENGGTFDSHNATLTFGSGSDGIRVEAGGTLHVDNDTLQTEACDCASTYKLDLAAGSTFFLHSTNVTQGQGVHDATNDTDFALNVLSNIPRALFLDGVTVNVHDSTFASDTVGINATGGQPTMERNTFQSTHDCIRDYQTDPTITSNTFQACIIGIWHEQSHSTIANNSLSEDQDPNSIGIVVLNGNSPVIEGNDITNFTTGVLVDHARAFVRNNTIHGNVGAGIRVVANTMPMDITGNVLDANGGDAMRLESASNVTLQGNVVRSSGGEGIVFDGSRDITSAGDSVSNVDFGFYLLGSDNVTVSDALATSDRVGVLVSGAGNNTILRTNASANQLDGFNFEQDAGDVTTLDHGIAIGNGRAGVYGVNGTSTATNGWYEGNSLAGVINDQGNPTLDATCSYWGSPTGPTANDNPGGAGDAVSGDVAYRPFATQPGGTCFNQNIG